MFDVFKLAESYSKTTRYLKLLSKNRKILNPFAFRQLHIKFTTLYYTFSSGKEIK